MDSPSTKPKRKARTGTLLPAGTWEDGTPRWRGRLALADGTKSERFDVPHGLDEEGARAFVASWQAQEDAQGGMLARKREKEREKARAAGVACEGESADTWHDRFLASRVGLVGNVESSRGRWRKWASPVIGHKPMAAVNRDDIEAIRDGLDAAIAAFREHGRGEGRLMPKSAVNVWSVVTTAFKVASQAKRATGLRVREDNPCANVLPPEKGDSRRKTWIYPAEFSQLAECEAVPLRWREVYAIACYLYLRPGELFELRWRDVDLEAEVVNVSRAWDWEARTVKAPKTANGERAVPIPAALLPLLSRMREGRGREDKVVPVMEQTGENKGARLLRDHLRIAGLDHPRLTQDTATHMPVGFRSWRDTGITWSAIDGVPLATLQRRAGHDDINTTLAYVKEAEDRSKLRGRVFPALPTRLVIAEASPDHFRTTSERKPRENRLESVPEEGVEPPT